MKFYLFLIFWFLFSLLLIIGLIYGIVALIAIVDEKQKLDIITPQKCQEINGTPQFEKKENWEDASNNLTETYIYFGCFIKN